MDAGGAVVPADRAPLSALPATPVPPGEAVWFAGVGGARLRAALFPAPDPIGSVVLSTGRAEYIEKYLEAIGEWTGRGFTVLAHDWRGQGLSQRLDPDRLKGCADGFDDFIADYGLLLDAFESRLPEPRIAFGHSMGGGLTLAALARGERRLSAAILSAPMLGLTAARNPLARPLAWLMARTGFGRAYVERSPPDPFATTFAGNALTHDPRRFDLIQRRLAAHPDLALGGVTWGWVDSALALMAWLARAPQIARLDLPIVVVAAQQDALVDNAALQTVARRLPKGRFVGIAGARHELLMETDDIRADFWREFDALAADLTTTA